MIRNLKSQMVPVVAYPDGPEDLNMDMEYEWQEESGGDQVGKVGEDMSLMLPMERSTSI